MPSSSPNDNQTTAGMSNSRSSLPLLALAPDGAASCSCQSIITSPSHGLQMGVPGVYQISRIAWTGAGKIKRVEVSADGGKEGVNDVLVGGQGTLITDRPRKTVDSYWPYATTLFDYVRRAMPYQAPGTLTNDETYAVTAYILFLNEIVDNKARMDAATLPDVKMPNRDNFVWDYSPD